MTVYDIGKVGPGHEVHGGAVDRKSRLRGVISTGKWGGGGVIHRFDLSRAIEVTFVWFG